jgi:murein DD-endopeptidase MepM/ murein hydrolase activator NlpD
MTAGGTAILAVELATVWKLSGHNPNEGVIDGDIFGWNTYLMTRDGLLYFYTHQGGRNVKVGERVKKGQVIGFVGNWPGDPGRSHTHLGVTHPMGERASKRAILNVSEAPRVKGT